MILSDDDTYDTRCSTLAGPGANSPSATASDSDVAAGVEIVDLVMEDPVKSSPKKREREEKKSNRNKSTSPSTSSHRSVRLKASDATLGGQRRTGDAQGQNKIINGTSSDSDDNRSNSHLSDGDSGRSGNLIRKPLTPDRIDGVDDVSGAVLPVPEETSDATAVNTAAAIETVLQGLARDDATESELGDTSFDEELKIPETMLAMPLLRHQKRAVSWMRKREAVGSSPRGGLLADDQGLGKTFSAIALIAANPPPPRWRSNNQSADKTKKPTGGTLVVCPTSVLRQWQRELESKVSKQANMKVLVHHGVGRTKLARELSTYDVVLTTFAVVGLEVSVGVGVASGSPVTAPAESNITSTTSTSSGAIGGVEWFRVILDEAQSVKNARSQVAAAVSAVSAKCRWCLSGTPLQNNVDDLFSYFRFLRYDPYDNSSSFRTLIKEPIRVDPVAGFRRLQHILRAVMLRRTKQSKINGQPIVRLPPRTVVHSQRTFLPAEQTAYAKLQLEYRGKMEEFAAAGTVSSNYVNLLHMLLRLRQACNHPSLVGGVRQPVSVALPEASAQPGLHHASSSADLSKTQGEDTALQSPAAKVPASAVAAARRLPAALRGMMRLAADHGKCVCSICGDPPSDPTVASCCARPFCGDCVSPRVDALVMNSPNNSGKKSNSKKTNANCAFADGLTADGFACPSCGVTLTRALLHSAAALVAADAPRTQVQGGSNTEDGGSQNRKSKSKINPSGPSIEKLMAGTKVRGIMDYLVVLREKHKTAVNAAKAKQSARGNKQQRQPLPPGGAVTAAAVAKGTQLRRGIRSSDAALAAALPPLAPVSAVHGWGSSTLTLNLSGSARAPISHTPTAEKAIVFSQWTAMLDLLEPCLRKAGIHFRRLDGTMSLTARERALVEFETKPDVTVILMSLKAAGLGVNLTCANHVILSDVWWNPTAEEQAIDRAHRIGQTKEVKVVRFTVRDTVEDRILALQDRKRAMVAAAFGDEAEDQSGSSRRAQLTTEDLVFLFGSEKDAIKK